MMTMFVLAEGVWEGALKGGLRGAIIGGIAGALAALCLGVFRLLKNRSKQPLEPDDADADDSMRGRRP
jgi:hypothetical protein